MQATTFLTRRQYDSLVATFPEWMEFWWAAYDRRWSIRGVLVAGSAVAVENLKALLARAGAN